MQDNDQSRKGKDAAAIKRLASQTARTKSKARVVVLGRIRTGSKEKA
jgi:hypothetical protein